ncbi:MAG TPA: 2,3-diaminopropionate biosynthesis protein SbnB [Thermoanaerobaculia bacterium]|nr:2,3-diaminopropionate biosynthesis protein SbnB [Thermoanaerobaculia bacterium]
MLILTGPEVGDLLQGRERDVLDAVERAYRQHADGNTSLPHSNFLLFPESPRNRIIALPAFLGGERPLAGLKWIASFPSNHELGLDRASAVMVVNSAETGVPQAILEGSIISAKRTAASAALAANQLSRGIPPPTVGLIGCGRINAEILHFLESFFPIRHVVVFDIDEGRAEGLRRWIQGSIPDARIEVAERIEDVLRRAPLVSFATTASEPHVENLDGCPAGATILHVSLRDLSVPAILSADNIVDDVDHVMRARTSVHLAEQFTGGRDFIRATLGEILKEEKPRRSDTRRVSVFSPFGLGILDLAVADLVLDLADRTGAGTRIPAFLPETWTGVAPADESAAAK